jgi:hypothetical protein
VAVAEKYSMFLLSSAWQLYLKENTYPLAHPVIPALLRSGNCEINIVFPP